MNLFVFHFKLLMDIEFHFKNKIIKLIESFIT